MGDPEQPRAGPERSGQDGRSGLSASGWAAVTALGAAAITAAVTLVTHFVPPMGAEQQVVAESSGAAPSANALLTPAPATARSRLGTAGQRAASGDVAEHEKAHGSPRTPTAWAMPHGSSGSACRRVMPPS